VSQLNLTWAKLTNPNDEWLTENSASRGLGYAAAAAVASAVANAPHLVRAPVMPLQVGVQFGVFETVKNTLASAKSVSIIRYDSGGCVCVVCCA